MAVCTKSNACWWGVHNSTEVFIRQVNISVENWNSGTGNHFALLLVTIIYIDYKIGMTQL